MGTMTAPSNTAHSAASRPFWSCHQLWRRLQVSNIGTLSNDDRKFVGLTVQCPRSYVISAGTQELGLDPDLRIAHRKDLVKWHVQKTTLSIREPQRTINNGSKFGAVQIYRLLQSCI